MVAMNQNAVQGKESGSIEDILASRLGMVNPDPIFVGNLRWRLTHKPEVEVEKPHYIGAVFTIGVGLFSGVLLFWVIGVIYKAFKAIIHCE